MRLRHSLILSILLHMLLLFLPFPKEQLKIPIKILEKKEEILFQEYTPVHISSLPSTSISKKEGFIELPSIEYTPIEKNVLLPPPILPAPSPIPSIGGPLLPFEAKIEGPAAERELLHKEGFDIPEWLKRKGLSLSGRVKFWVLPSGRIKNAVLEESFGFYQIDELACKAISKWRFSPCTHGKLQWGIVHIKILLQ